MARHGLEASNDRMASAVQRVQALLAKVKTSSAAEAKEVREIEEQVKQAVGGWVGKSLVKHVGIIISRTFGNSSSYTHTISSIIISFVIFLVEIW